MTASGREQLEAIAGRGKSTSGMKLSTPKGFGVISLVFSDMRRHYPGTWFIDGETKLSLRQRAGLWSEELSVFDREVVVEALSDFIDSGNYSAPSLDDFKYLCQKKKASLNEVTRADKVAARDKAMNEIDQIGLIK